MLNMELDLQIFLSSCVQLYSLAETPQLPPPPAFGPIYKGAIGQPRYTTYFCNPLSHPHEPIGELVLTKIFKDAELYNVHI